MGSLDMRSLAASVAWTAAVVLAVGCSETDSGPGGSGGAPPSGEPCSDEGSFESCYPGPATSRGVGPCSDGARTCRGGYWTECVGAIVPTEEQCDGVLDDDCDGLSDEGCPCDVGVGRSCYTGPGTTRAVGACTDGEQQCPEGTWGDECVGQVLPATADACSGLDDDCNGVTDEGCTCTPDCDGRCAGPDGCGNECPDGCVAPDTCGGGAAEDECGCTPDCISVECGDDGCGGQCPTCAAGLTCYEGRCYTDESGTWSCDEGGYNDCPETTGEACYPVGRTESCIYTGPPPPGPWSPPTCNCIGTG